MSKTIRCKDCNDSGYVISEYVRAIYGEHDVWEKVEPHKQPCDCEIGRSKTQEEIKNLIK